MIQAFRSLAYTALTLLGVSAVIFVLMRVVPGDPVATMIPPGAGPEDIARLKAFYGLDRSIAEQYVLWLHGAVHGHFGVSIAFKQEVFALVAQRLPATLELGVLALVLACFVGGAAGVVSAQLHGRLTSSAIDSVAALVQAVPDFLWGLLLILSFGVFWPILPISGRVDPLLVFRSDGGFVLIESLLQGRFDVFSSALMHMVAPAVSLALPLAAMIARVLKASVQESLASDYVLLARLKGLGTGRILLGEALPNALTPTLQLTGVQFTFLLGGTVLIERLFSYPGIGSLAISAVVARDFPLIQAIVLTFALLFILVNLGVEVATLALNPRLRSARP